MSKSTQSNFAYIAFGSNLDDPLTHIRRGVALISQLPDTVLDSHSSLFQSKPVGNPDQPDFINGVIRIKTSLTARELLKACQAIEEKEGRVRTEAKNEPRTLDLDILFFGNEIINEPDLHIPHPRMNDRAFVLFPLYEIEPDLFFPTGEALFQLINACDPSGIVRLEESL